MIPVNIKPIDPDEPPFPEISFPKWLSPAIQVVLRDRLELLKTQQKIERRQVFDLYAYLVHIFNKVKIVFTDKRMKPIWEKLESLSKEKTADFASQLLSRIENDYDGGLTLIDKHRAEIASSERVIAAAKRLRDEMQNYQYEFYGHMIQENHSELIETLNMFIDTTAESLEQFEEHIKSEFYMFCDLWPITRQNKDKSSLPIFYMRKIYLIFMKSFRKPMYTNIAEIVNVIFNSEYTENHAIKYCAKVRPLLCDNSKEK